MNLKNYPWWRRKKIKLQKTREYLQDILTKHGLETPGNISLILLNHVLNRSKSWLLAHGEYDLDDQEIHTLQVSLEQLLQGVPLPYILGHWDFYGRTFHVNPNVLIPRPETELLVEKAIQYAKKSQQPTIIDVGTGSGAIALSLAAELPSAMIIATDLSLAALKTAQINAQRLDQLRVKFIQSNLLSPFQTQFDLICANLPYIPSHVLDTLEVSKWEPCLALDGGKSGLDAIRMLLMQARTRLAPAGIILLETETSLGKPTMIVARDAFPDAKCQLLTDLAGHDRVVEIRLG